MKVRCKVLQMSNSSKAYSLFFQSDFSKKDVFFVDGCRSIGRIYSCAHQLLFKFNFIRNIPRISERIVGESNVNASTVLKPSCL